MLNFFRNQKIILKWVLISTFSFVIGTCGYLSLVQHVEANRSVQVIPKEATEDVLFYKDTCPDCQKVYNEFFFKKYIMQKNIRFINLNQKANRKYISKYSLKEVPTVIQLTNGKEKARFVGNEVEKYLAKRAF